MAPIGKDLINLEHCSSEAALAFLRKFSRSLAATGRYNLQDVRLVGIIAEDRTISRMSVKDDSKEKELTTGRQDLLNSLLKKATKNAMSCDEIRLVPVPDPDFF